MLIRSYQVFWAAEKCSSSFVHHCPLVIIGLLMLYSYLQVQAIQEDTPWPAAMMALSCMSPLQTRRWLPCWRRGWWKKSWLHACKLSQASRPLKVPQRQSKVSRFTLYFYCNLNGKEQQASLSKLFAGVESTYVWQGKVETEAEHLLLIKTQQASADTCKLQLSSEILLLL